MTICKACSQEFDLNILGEFGVICPVCATNYKDREKIKDTSLTRPTCPHCGNESTCLGNYYEGPQNWKEKCIKCGKKYKVEMFVDITYTTTKIGNK